MNPKELELPDLFEDLWNQYFVPAIRERLGKLPETKINFYSAIDQKSFKTNMMIDGFTKFINEVIDISAAESIEKSKKIKELESEIEMLNMSISFNESNTKIGAGIAEIIEKIKGH
jgi:hypothetical protein